MKWRRIVALIGLVAWAAPAAQGQEGAETSTYGRIRAAIDAIPAIDTHDHLWPFDRLPGLMETDKGRGMTLYGLWRASYFPQVRPPTPRQPGEAFAAWWDRARHDFDDARAAGFYRYQLPAFRDLYGVDFDRITDEQAAALDAKIFDNYRDERWIHHVVTERANIELMLNDPYWGRFDFKTHYPFEVLVFNVTTLLDGFHPSEFKQPADDPYLFAGERDMKVESLDDYLAALDRLFRVAKEKGAVCLKTTRAYQRTLRFEDVPKEQAARIFGRPRAELTAEEVKDFQDFVMWRLVELSAKHELPFQIHTGHGRLQGSNPLLLVDLIEANPKTKFILFHGGYPWVGETGAIVLRHGSHVWVDSVWLPTISPTMARRALHEWLEVMPSDRLLWGADCNHAEGIYGATVTTRRVLAEVLAEKVERGELLEEHAQRIGRQVLRDNALKLFPQLKDRLRVRPEPVPDKLVVLTLDDAVKSHHSVVRPILKRYGFGATFFVTEGFDFLTDKTDYMTWAEIAELHSDGFEIGNHTRDHLGVKPGNVDRLAEQVRAIADRCIEHKIPAPVSFAWPGNSIDPTAFAVLKANGVRLARRGGSPEYPYEEGRGFAYEPGLDHPLLIPSAGDARPDWTIDDFKAAVAQARRGRIAVLQFHGVPDRAHPWVHTSPEQFEAYMGHLAQNGYRVIAMRDLAKYLDPEITPTDPFSVVEDRKRLIAAGKSPDEIRRPADDEDLRSWLENMSVLHGYSPSEIGAASGLSADEVAAALKRFGLVGVSPPQRRAGDPLVVRPYPGGRHPRIGFLDGAIRPQRESKVSVFAPWENGGYVVVDVPEAIWSRRGDSRELLYLAHTHVPTLWDKQGVELERLEWTREPSGVLSIRRELPDGVTFGAEVTPAKDEVRMELWITNGTKDTLSGLVVQNCVMLGAAAGFGRRSNENKVFDAPYAACRDAAGGRWIITAWKPCVRPWANAPCPCLHSDPQFPDCPPGETRRIRGWLSFYEGDDVNSEFRRIEASRWWEG